MSRLTLRPEPFLPFGDIKDISIPMDHSTGKHKGFGFVEYEDKGDAADAIDNMHNAELFGKVLRVNFAQPMKIKGGDKGWSHQAVWADADRYMEELEAEQELDDYDTEMAKKQKDLERSIASAAAAEAAATLAASSSAVGAAAAGKGVGKGAQSGVDAMQAAEAAALQSAKV
ncbi:MAG: hypothetical protein WDW38_002056 [Sanguina aurantia]